MAATAGQEKVRRFWQTIRVQYVKCAGESAVSSQNKSNNNNDNKYSVKKKANVECENKSDTSSNRGNLTISKSF